MQITARILNWVTIYFFWLISNIVVGMCQRWLENRPPQRVPKSDGRRGCLASAVETVLALFLWYFFNAYVGAFSVTQVPDFIKPENTVLTEGHINFNSNVLFHIVHPQRGSIVTAFSEQNSGLDQNWRSEVDMKFHFKTSEKVGAAVIRRVVAVPGESVHVSGGHIYINGQELIEPYVRQYAFTDDGVTLQLSPDEFLLARDVRSDIALKEPQTFLIVNIKQIKTREVFVLWPLKFFGFVRTPSYNIPNPPVFKIHLNEPLLRLLTSM
jgi:signal peptidase I